MVVHKNSKKRLKTKKIISTYVPKFSTQLILKQKGLFVEKQIEAARRIISKKTNRVSKAYMQYYSTSSLTKKPKGSRMGKGKGKFDKYIFKYKPGAVLLLLNCVTKGLSISALKYALKKLPKFKIYIS